MNDEEKKDLLEHRKWIEEIEHMLEQRSHWKERANAQDKQYNERANAQDKQYKERANAQDKHWQWQKAIWFLTVLIALAAIFNSPYFNLSEKTTIDNQKIDVKK